MDIYCPQCGEPWDNDSFHEYANETGQTYRDVTREFRSSGCGAFADWGVSPCKADNKALIRSAILDICGDDMDGYASDMDDFMYAGLL